MSCTDHCSIQGSPQGPVMAGASHQQHLDDRRMKLVAARPVAGRARRACSSCSSGSASSTGHEPSRTITPSSRRRTLKAESPSNPAPATRHRHPARSYRRIRGPSRAVLAAALAPPPSAREWHPPPARFFCHRSRPRRPAARPGLSHSLRRAQQLCQRADRHDSIVQDEAIIALESADAVRRQAYGFQHGVHGNTEKLPSASRRP